MADFRCIKCGNLDEQVVRVKLVVEKVTRTRLVLTDSVTNRRYVFCSECGEKAYEERNDQGRAAR